MKNLRTLLRSHSAVCLLRVGLCFGLTSAVYLSWLDRLIRFAGGPVADWVSMNAGYLLQAAGIGLVCFLLRSQQDPSPHRLFSLSLLAFAAVSVPALLADSAAGVIGFGLAINLFCGIIAGFYLDAVGRTVAAGRRAVVFGGGYALGTVAVGLLALIGQGSLLHSRGALLLYLPLSAAAAFFVSRPRPLSAGAAPSPAPADRPASLLLAGSVVFLLSTVKNLGFSFPSADVETGLLPELTRLPYAIGLLAAGLIHTRSRRDGALCTVAALVLPFLMLGLTSEPVPAAICWGLDYLFFGFFSVFRVVLFLDLAEQARRPFLAPLGLLFGRLGDVAGTAAGLLLSGRKVLLILLTLLLFFPTVWLFYRLWQRLYEPHAVQQRSEREVFEAFCLHHDLSAREKEVLRMVLDSHSNGEIAEALFITESTVKYHVRNVLQKVGCRNRVELQKKYTLTLYPQMAGELQAAEASDRIIPIDSAYRA